MVARQLLVCALRARDNVNTTCGNPTGRSEEVAFKKEDAYGQTQDEMAYSHDSMLAKKY